MGYPDEVVRKNIGYISILKKCSGSSRILAPSFIFGTGIIGRTIPAERFLPRHMLI
jgi:hypothetical protein